MSKGWTVPPRHPLRRLLDGLVQHAFFQRLGIPDPRRGGRGV
ncbi:MAG: hypothetical protein ACYSWU_05300 [Planctomycetota bacterium]|jgi:hypothetical protein